MKFKCKPRPDSLILACLRSMFTLAPSVVLHSTTLSCRLEEQQQRQRIIHARSDTELSNVHPDGKSKCTVQRLYGKSLRFQYHVILMSTIDECEATGRNKTTFYIHSSPIKACWLLVMDQVSQSFRTRISASERSFIVRLGHGEDAFAKKSHYHAILRQATFSISQYGQYLGR